MNTPRSNRTPGMAAPLAMLLALLTGGSLHAVTPAASPAQAVQANEKPVPRIPQRRPTPADLLAADESFADAALVPAPVRAAAATLSVLALSPYGINKRKPSTNTPIVTAKAKYPPSMTPPALVVKPPLRPAEQPKPPGKNPDPKGVPEPSSLGAGLVGGALTLAAWWRKRRRSVAVEAPAEGGAS